MFMRNQRIRLTLNFLSFLLFSSFSQTLFAVKLDSLLHYDDGMVVHTSEAAPFLGSGTAITLWEKGIIKIAYNHAGARSDISAAQIITDLQKAFTILEGVAELDFQFLCESNASPMNLNDDIVVVGL